LEALSCARAYERDREFAHMHERRIIKTPAYIHPKRKRERMANKSK
jgi:hypothetical protein